MRITVRRPSLLAPRLTSEVSGKILALALTFALMPVATADDHRAGINYMIHCQGCHLPEAMGFAGKVPRMKDFVGYFLHSREGREFIIRVPGVATSSLPDDELTEMMNWLLRTYSADQLPKPFVPFSTEEVAELRPDLEANPGQTRMRILERIARDLPSLAVELEQESGR